jgi:IS30 family transposase
MVHDVAHLPHMTGHDDGIHVKNSPALAGPGTEAVRNAVACTIMILPIQMRRSLTWDQRAKLSQHAQLRVGMGVQVYSCNLNSPWQRGTNENTNGRGGYRRVG